MTLIETVVGMAVIILVTILAYVGVSASSNFMQHGADLRNSDGKAVKNIEENLKAVRSQGTDEGAETPVTSITNIPYTVEVEVSDSDGISKSQFEGNFKAAVVTGQDENVVYKYYMPPVTTSQ